MIIFLNVVKDSVFDIGMLLARLVIKGGSGGWTRAVAIID